MPQWILEPSRIPHPTPHFFFKFYLRILRIQRFKRSTFAIVFQKMRDDAAKHPLVYYTLGARVGDRGGGFRRCRRCLILPPPPLGARLPLGTTSLASRARVPYLSCRRPPDDLLYSSFGTSGDGCSGDWSKGRTRSCSRASDQPWTHYTYNLSV